MESEQSAKLRCASGNVEEILDRVERELLVWRSMHGIRPEERVSCLMPPVSVPHTQPETGVRVLEDLMPAIHTRSPVHLHSPVCPVPCTHPEDCFGVLPHLLFCSVFMLSFCH